MKILCKTIKKPILLFMVIGALVSCEKENLISDESLSNESISIVDKINTLRNDYLSDGFDIIVTENKMYDLSGSISTEDFNTIKLALDTSKNIYHYDDDGTPYVFAIPGEKILELEEVDAYIQFKLQNEDGLKSSKKGKYRAKYWILFASNLDGSGERTHNFAGQTRKHLCDGHTKLFERKSFGKNADKSRSVYVNVDWLEDGCNRGDDWTIGVAMKWYDNADYKKHMLSPGFTRFAKYSTSKMGRWISLKKYNYGFLGFVDKRINGVKARAGLVKKDDEFFGTKWNY